MKLGKMTHLFGGIALAALLGLAGCETTNTTQSNVAQPAASDGLVHSVRAYPTGDKATSVATLEKILPPNVAVGQPFNYTLSVTNLTDQPIRDVVIVDNCSQNFKLTNSTPQAQTGQNGQFTWALGDIGPKETKSVQATAVASGEGSINSCANIQYNSNLCSATPVVQPKLAMTISAPASVVICDPIPVKITVTNNGTGDTTNVVVKDPLPDGLTTIDGKNSIDLNAGTLSAGQSKDATVQVKASKTGDFSQKATASADGGLTADGSAPTSVHQPVLTVAITGPDKVFIGRPATYETTVTNTSDTNAATVVIVDTVPAGVSVDSASDNGRLITGQNKLRWDIGDLAPKASKKVTFTITGAGQMSNEIDAWVQSICSTAQTAVTKTDVVGIPAILLEMVDVTDPIQVGQVETYVITVTNQGSATDTDIKLVATLEENETFASASGATNGTANGQDITFEPLPSLAAKDKAVWQVKVNCVKEGDVRFKVSIKSAQLQREVIKTESTNIYK